MEIWKDIKDYEGLYEVSNQGRVRSLKTGRLRKPKDNFGYLRINLCKEGIVKFYMVHRLVAEAFIENNNPNLTQVNHKNENKQDNRVENLEWCDAKYNCNYGNHTKKQVESQIKTGYLNPNMIGLDNKTYQRLYMRQYRQRKRLGN
jgi:hypothetical protein